MLLGQLLQVRTAVLGMITAGGLALSTVPSQAGLLNPSFEMGLASINPFVTLTAPDGTSITNWTVYFGTVDYVGNYWQAAQGNRSIDLNGISPGGIMQTFDVEVLHDYRLTFSLSGNPDGQGVTAGARGPKTLTVYACNGPAPVGAGGVPTRCGGLPGTGIPFTYNTLTTGNTRAAMAYTTASLTFTTRLTAETLFFLSTTTGPYGPVIDNLDLMDLGPIGVPEPGSIALLLTGLAGAAIVRRPVRRGPGKLATQ